MSEKPNTILPKWPFLVGDIVLILLACFIVIASPKPMTGIGIFACALSVILGMLVYITPYVIEHLTQQQRIKLKQAKAEETLLKAVELASDLLNRTESIHAELMKGVLSVKQVPTTLEEKAEELTEILDSDKLTSSLTELSDLLNRIEAQGLRDRASTSDDHSIPSEEILNAIQALEAPDLSTLESAIDSKIEELRNELLEKLQELEQSQKEAISIANTLQTSSIEEEDSNPEETEAEEEEAEAFNDSSDQEEQQEEEEEEEEEEDDDDDDEPELIDEADEDAVDSENSSEEIDLEEVEALDEAIPEQVTHEIEEDAIQHNEDGATRLLVGAFIGISNKLYIRGEGPGLDWDKGVPMELVGIGKWEWKTYDANTTVNCKVLINDEQWTDSENIAIEPNTTVETTASF